MVISAIRVLQTMRSTFIEMAGLAIVPQMNFLMLELVKVRGLLKRGFN